MSNKKELNLYLYSIYGDKELDKKTLSQLKTIWREHPELIKLAAEHKNKSKLKLIPKPDAPKFNLKREVKKYDNRRITDTPKEKPKDKSENKPNDDLRHIKSFSDAFAEANRRKLKTFAWGKSRYGTEKDSNYKEKWKLNKGENKESTSNHKSTESKDTKSNSNSSKESTSKTGTLNKQSTKSKLIPKNLSKTTKKVSKSTFKPSIEIGPATMMNPYVTYLGDNKAEVSSNSLDNNGNIIYSSLSFIKNPAGTSWEIIPKVKVSYDGSIPKATLNNFDILSLKAKNFAKSYNFSNLYNDTFKLNYKAVSVDTNLPKLEENYSYMPNEIFLEVYSNKDNTNNLNNYKGNNVILKGMSKLHNIFGNKYN